MAIKHIVIYRPAQNGREGILAKCKSLEWQSTVFTAGGQMSVLVL